MFWCHKPGEDTPVGQVCFTEKLKVVPGPFPGKAEQRVPACLAWLLLCVPGAALHPQHILAKPEEVLSEVTARG